jgi:heavy metal sensor kinase
VAEFRGTSGLRDVQTDRGRLRITSTVINPPGSGGYLVQVGALLDRLDVSLREFDRVLVMRTAGGVVLAALMGLIFSGWALAPLRRLASDARGIEITNLRARLPVRGAGDELDHVAVAFNQALARLERSVNEMRQFSAAVAHELRTPLAILRGEAEMALASPFSLDQARERLRSQLDEYDRLTRLINQILMLARAEAGEIHLTMAPVDVSLLARTVGDQVEALADAKDIALAQHIDAGVRVIGDSGWLERLLLVLLDNAIKFTPPGGQVTLRVSRAGDRAQLIVEDTGVGIDPDAVDRVFDPFYRADAAQTRQTEGAGIGLALAKWIAGTHGASLTATSTPGRGSIFTVTISAEDAIKKI